jgi:hypothetical protein
MVERRYSGFGAPSLLLRRKDSQMAECHICQEEIDPELSSITIFIRYGHDAIQFMKEQRNSPNGVVRVPTEVESTGIDTVDICNDCGRPFNCLLNGMMLVSRNVAIVPLDMPSDGIG